MPGELGNDLRLQPDTCKSNLSVRTETIMQLKGFKPIRSCPERIGRVKLSVRYTILGSHLPSKHRRSEPEVSYRKLMYLHRKLFRKVLAMLISDDMGRVLGYSFRSCSFLESTAK